MTMKYNETKHDTIFVATRNAGKLKEIQRLLGNLPIRIVSYVDFPDLPEIKEEGLTFQENALHKAQETTKETGMLVLADDSGLVVDFLDGQPGVYSARFAGENATDEDNNKKLLELLQGVPLEQRTARFVCEIAITTPAGKAFTACGFCEGIILESGLGNKGFGYDPLFYVREFKKTMAQLDLKEKNMISHRGKALKNAVHIIQGLLLDR